MKEESNRPVQTDSQSLGDIGETTVQLILRKYKWTADIIKSDFGEDIDCNIFIDNTRTNYHLRCQVKSTTKDSDYVKKLKNGNFSVSIDSVTLRAWLTSYFPVLLIIYEEDSDSCFWCNPIDQILDIPSKLEKKKPSIQVPRANEFNSKSKEVILKEVKKFYRKIQRLDESITECKVVPILMPNYKLIPFLQYGEFIYSDVKLKPEIFADFIELLPSWMSVLKRIDPSNTLPSIKLKSTNPDLEIFINQLKQKILSFKYKTKDKEWISFIVSPIKIKSNKSSWSNELTYWTSFSIINNKVVSDFDYCFEVPNDFLSQVSRRARSWDYLHHVNPKKDIAIQFFSSYEVTPSIKKIDQIHDNNIKGQLVLWKCKRNEIEAIANLVAEYNLTIKLVEDKSHECLIAITTHFFNSNIGIYRMPMDWESFENGNVKNQLIQYEILEKIPGSEYSGEIPNFLAKSLNRYSEKKYEQVFISEMEYISGFPLLIGKREIHASRFQMLKKEEVKKIKAKLKNIKNLKLKNFQIEFCLKDDSIWEIPIYELLIKWTPDIFKASKDSYIEVEKKILYLFDQVMPSKSFSPNNNNPLELNGTFEILHVAGLIEFEKNEG